MTCLPGAFTVLRTGAVLANAAEVYARPAADKEAFTRQVQYQGTDRRLTWCLLSQGKHVRTIMETQAYCYTEPPQSLSHYLSQRKRWGSNAFFNSLFTIFGPGQWTVTRLWMVFEVSRTALVYFRLVNL